MQNATSPLISDQIDIIEICDTGWVESITLPTYSDRHHSRFVTLQRNYTFIKHMMSAIGLKNCDFLIVRDIDNVSQITIKFNNNSQQYASMAVLLWSKYKDAKLESNL